MTAHRQAIGRTTIFVIIGLSVSMMFEMAVHAQMRLTPIAQVPLLGGGDWSTDVQRLTLVGALVIAVGVLWKTQQAERIAKDTMAKEYAASLINATKITTDALIASSNSAAELRRVIEESVTTKRELAESINLLRVSLGELPCTRPGNIMEPVMIRPDNKGRI